MSHAELLSMPWVTFVAYLAVIGKEEKRADDARFFGEDQVGLAEWEEHSEEWVRNQQNRLP